MKKCLYCSCDVDDNSVIDFCEKCGLGVFGDRMLKTICKNMEEAREKGDLYQGIICDMKSEDIKKNIDNLDSAKSL
tara:strand:- start:1359 stop:1586 length:228 start_codon:yes stop_codon:yes gene_type:complete